MPDFALTEKNKKVPAIRLTLDTSARLFDAVDKNGIKPSLLENICLKK